MDKVTKLNRCLICEVTFPDNVTVHNHFLNVHQKGTFLCNISGCNYVANTNGDLRMHCLIWHLSHYSLDVKLPVRSFNNSFCLSNSKRYFFVAKCHGNPGQAKDSDNRSIVGDDSTKDNIDIRCKKKCNSKSKRDNYSNSKDFTSDANEHWHTTAKREATNTQQNSRSNDVFTYFNEFKMLNVSASVSHRTWHQYASKIPSFQLIFTQTKKGNAALIYLFTFQLIVLIHCTTDE